MDEDKHTALVVLGVIVILAIIGLLLIAKTVKTDKAQSEVIIPIVTTSEVIEQPGFAEKATTTQKQTQKIAVTEKPAAVQSYSWTQKPTTSIKYGESIKTCRELTYVGTIQSGYSIDAGLAGTTGKDCVRVDGSLQGFCCRP